MTGGYAATDHASMIADERRVAAYAAAMKAAIRPGCTVFEIGTGCGLFALHACALGAARVFAIEAEDSYFVARDVIRKSPHAHKIELAHGLSTDVTLPQRADVIISDLHGVMPMFGAHIESIADARARHLAEGGVLIPESDTLWAAPVHCPSLHATHRAYLSAPLGIDLSAAQRYSTSNWSKRTREPVTLLADERSWGVIDYRSVTSPNQRGAIDFIANQAGELQGFSAWFDGDLGFGAKVSNHPSKPRHVYGSAFFPLEQPVSLEIGDRVDLELQAHRVDGEYIWQWASRVSTEAGSEKAHSRQSTFEAHPIDASTLALRASGFSPQATESSDIERFILEQIDGQKSNRAIADRLRQRFSSAFASDRAALSRVTDVVVKHRERRVAFEEAR